MKKQSRVAAIVLAAGLGTRMGGQPKPLLPFGDRTIIEHILSILDDCDLAESVIVTGHYHQAIEECLSGMPITLAFNPDYANGEMLNSLQVGLQAVSEMPDAALILLGDQPALEPAVVQAVVAAYEDGLGSIVMPSFQMRRGHPLLIERKHWDAILGLRAGQTLRDFMRAVNAEIYHVEVNTSSILRDMDTPDEYQRELAEYINRIKTGHAIIA
ncbi:MAG: nucleotidyltransferase family protein [Chloroflexi bacterium]|nr:nucleotidyltransferase family protein [Chloroflexota bacterium]